MLPVERYTLVASIRLLNAITLARVLVRTENGLTPFVNFALAGEIPFMASAFFRTY